MHAILETPFDRLRWTSQDIADAVPLRLHELDLFGTAARGAAAASANAARLQRGARGRHAYIAADALPARFQIR